MGKGNYLPYNFDIKYQYKTYVNVGTDYKLHCCAANSKRYKLRQVYRKWSNKEEQKYKKFDTYSQWETYVKSLFVNMQCRNGKDFKHYLLELQEESDLGEMICSSIAVPVIMALLTGFITVCVAEKMDGIVALILFEAVLMASLIYILILLYRYRRWSGFLSNIIDIWNEYDRVI